MYGVAAEVAIEVFVMFQESDWNSGAREEEGQHHSCGATADYTASGFERLVRGVTADWRRRVCRRRRIVIHGRVLCQRRVSRARETKPLQRPD